MNIKNTNFLQKTRKLGFTLVELIIVITILTILATIAFISFKNYNGNARDGNRMTTLKSIEKGLNLSFVKTSEFPIPDNYINILTGSNILIKQGVVGRNITQIIKLNKEVKDPKDDDFYIYSISNNQQLFQIGTYLETNNLISYIPKTYANTDYSNRYFYTLGNKVGIMIKENGKPVGIEDIEIQLGNENNTNYKIYFSNDTHSGSISGTGDIITKTIQDTQNIPKNNGGGENSGISCDINQHNEGGTCVSDIKNCSGENGVGSQNWNGSVWGECNINSCNEGYVLDGNNCIQNTKVVNCRGSVPWSGYANIGAGNISIALDGQTPSWSHSNTTPGACQYQCKVGTYFNGNTCVQSDIGSYVDTLGATTQKPCPNGQITSQKGATHINQCYVPKFTQICNTLDASNYYNTIIYTSSSGVEIGRVDYNGNKISGSPENLSIDGHIIVCGEDIFHRYVLKVVNQGAYGIGGYDTWGMASHSSYGNYYTFGDGSSESWGVPESVHETITWAGSTEQNKEKMQGPCESGYHVPTYYEWRSIVLLMGGSNVSNSLKLPFAGVRHNNDSNVTFQGQTAYYWTSSPDPGWGGAHYVSPSSSGQLYSGGHYPNTSISVRCFKNDVF